MNEEAAQEFSIQQAKLAHQNGRSHEWITDYLRGPGNNSELADILDGETEAEIILINFPLEKLSRVAGPEREMPYKESYLTWEKRVTAIVDLLKQGHEFPPLIVSDIWEFTLNDGSHRHEAFKRFGHKEYWTFFYVKDPKHKDRILKEAL